MRIYLNQGSQRVFQMWDRLCEDLVAGNITNSGNITDHSIDRKKTLSQERSTSDR